MTIVLSNDDRLIDKNDNCPIDCLITGDTVLPELPGGSAPESRGVLTES